MTRYRKSWTGVIEEIILNEALKPLDKSVVDAFYYKKEKAGKVVSTDGDSLWKNGLGGQEIAIWNGRKIKITAVSDVKSTESIIKYIRKSIPSGILEEVEEKIDMDKPQYGGSRHKKIEKDKYNKKRKGQGIEDDVEEGVTLGDQLDQIVKDAALDEKWAVGGVYHQEYKNGDKTYFRADSVQKNKRWKGKSVDEVGGKQKKPKNNTADERVQGWETTPEKDIPKALKESFTSDYLKFAKAQRGQGPEPLKDWDADKWVKEIERGVKVPWIRAQVSSITPGNSVLIKLTLEAEKDWPNNILQNARFGMLRIDPAGEMEMFASHRHLKNMRKTKIKSSKDAIQKINTWIKKVDEETLAGGVEIEEDMDEKLVSKIKFKHKSQYAAPKKKGKKVSGGTADQPFAFGISRKAADRGYGPKKGAPIMMGDEVEGETKIDEKKSATGYELYHKDFSSAMQHAYKFAKSKGFVIDPKEIDDKVATGPKKPSSGKTNRYSLKAGRKKVEIQVANLDNKRYELNMYIEEKEINEILPAIGAAIARAAVGSVIKSKTDLKSKSKKKQPKLGEENMDNIEEGRPSAEDAMGDARDKIAANRKKLGISKDPEDDKDEPKTGMQKASDKVGAGKMMNDYKPKLRKENLVSAARRVLMGEDSDKDEPGTQGDSAEYQKKRDEILKGYGVKACALLKDDKEKKQCFQDLDDAHVADHEEQAELKKKVKSEGKTYLKGLGAEIQKKIKSFEKKQKDLFKKFPDLKIKTFVYNPDTGKPDIEIKEGEELSESFWKVNIPEMPVIFIETSSKSEIIKDMRKKLKPDVFKELSIERVTKADMIKTYRQLVKGEGGDDEVKESVALQLKMALGDAGVKIKGAKGGKLVVDKKDKKKAMKALAKSFKKGKAPELQFEDPVDPNPDKTISKLFSHVKGLMKGK